MFGRIQRVVRPIVLVLLLWCAASVASPQTVAAPPDGFPLSVWIERKEVTQIPWTFSVGQPHLRSDFRQELPLIGSIRFNKREATDDVPDLVMLARVLENGQSIGPIHSVSLRDQAKQATTLVLPRYTHTLLMPAIVRPGRYRLEVALLNRDTGRYNTRYESVTITGKPDDLIERSFSDLDKFEFGEIATPESREDLPPPPLAMGLPLSIQLNVQIHGGILHNRLGAIDSAVSAAPSPRFVIDAPGMLKLSILSVLSPPEKATEEEYTVRAFQASLTNLLSVLTRFDVVHGSSNLIALDLSSRTRTFDRINLNDVQFESLRSAIMKDWSVVSLKDLADRSDSARFLRDALEERLREAEGDTTGATHAIIIAAARSAFRNSGAKTTIPAAGNCHCKIFYIRFGFTSSDADDMPRLLSAYKPQIFEPSNWAEFRDQFNTIYGQLTRY
jgi:hypothetical protein